MADTLDTQNIQMSAGDASFDFDLDGSFDFVAGDASFDFDFGFDFAFDVSALTASCQAVTAACQAVTAA